MELQLKRIALKSTYTIGRLFINGEKFCDTIEDKVRDYNKDGDLLDEGEDKVFGKTAIPYGRYKVRVSMSSKFKRLLPEILDVPHFTGIRIHAGNTAEDSHGCPLVGENKEVGKVLNSRPYEKKLVEILLEAEANKEEIWITIV